jgi:DNA-directed RNA polymerase subunit RPC12/RpoP
MPISFHCENCKKIVNAPDDAGGKWGKCPHCQHRCYIPSQKNEDEEELKLKPLDENEETQYDSMMDETRDITKDILHLKPEKEDKDTEPEPTNEKQIIALLIKYIRLMAKGDLDRCEQITEQLAKNPEKTKDILSRMLRSGSPEPELADIPQPLVQGFIKKLKNQIG